MKKNYDKKTKQYRFVKVNGVDDIKDFIAEKDIYKPVFLDEKTKNKLIHIKENLYELNGDYYIPSNY